MIIEKEGKLFIFHKQWFGCSVLVTNSSTSRDKTDVQVKKRSTVNSEENAKNGLKGSGRP